LKVWQDWALAREYDVIIIIINFSLYFDEGKYTFLPEKVFYQMALNKDVDIENFQFCHANNKQVTRRLVQFWQNFQISHVLLIPICTRHRMITYTYKSSVRQ
jgi:hypothetical protein